jgi:hypothetical protein
MLILRATRVKRLGPAVVASFRQYACSGQRVIPAKAGIHLATLCGRGPYELDSRLRGNDALARRTGAANDATTGDWRIRRPALTGSGRRYISIAARQTGHC